MPVRGVPGSLMGTEWLLRQTYAVQQWVPFPHAGRTAYCAASAQGDPLYQLQSGCPDGPFKPHSCQEERRAVSGSPQPLSSESVGPKHPSA